MRSMQVLAMVVGLTAAGSAYPVHAETVATAIDARRRAVGPPPQGSNPECAPGLVARGSNVFGIVVDGGHVYYGTGTDLMKVGSDGSADPILLTRLSAEVGLITMDDTHLFFGSFDKSGRGAVNAMPKDGHTPQVIIPGAMLPYEIATDDRYVYVSTLGTLNGDSFLHDGKIIRALKDGSEVKILASALFFPLGLAVSGGDVYFGERNTTGSGRISRVSIDGGPVTTVADDVAVMSLAADRDNLYFSGLDLRTRQGVITRVARNGFAQSVLVQKVFSQSLRIIGAQLYYSKFEKQLSTIEAVSVTGGTPRVVQTVKLFSPWFTSDSCLLYHSSGDVLERSAQ